MLSEKKDLKRQTLSPPQVTDLDDDEMEEGEAANLSLPSKSQKHTQNSSVSSSYGSTGTKGPIDTYYPLKPGNESGKSGKNLQVVAKGILRGSCCCGLSKVDV